MMSSLRLLIGGTARQEIRLKIPSKTMFVAGNMEKEEDKPLSPKVLGAIIKAVLPLSSAERTRAILAIRSEAQKTAFEEEYLEVARDLFGDVDSIWSGHRDSSVKVNVLWYWLEKRAGKEACSRFRVKSRTQHNISPEEKMCRETLERYYNVPFPRSCPEFLRDQRTGRNLELDGYCSELKIAFEYKGQEHYTVEGCGGSKTDLLERIFNDRRKAISCFREGVHLIVVPCCVPLGGIHDFVIANLPPDSPLGQVTPSMETPPLDDDVVSITEIVDAIVLLEEPADRDLISAVLSEGERSKYPRDYYNAMVYVYGDLVDEVKKEDKKFGISLLWARLSRTIGDVALAEFRSYHVPSKLELRCRHLLEDKYGCSFRSYPFFLYSKGNTELSLSGYSEEKKMAFDCPKEEESHLRCNRKKKGICAANGIQLITIMERDDLESKIERELLKA